MTYAAIFDMDGTLVDSFEAHWLSWQEIAKENNIVYTREMYNNSFGRPFKSIVELFWRRNGSYFKPDGSPMFSDAEMKVLEDRKEELYRVIFRENFILMPGVESFLSRLKDAGFKIAIGSSGPKENIEMVVDKINAIMGRTDIFDATVSCNEVTIGKPDPEIFLKAAQKLGISPKNCCVFEDSDSGIEAAFRAGMRRVAIFKPDCQYASLSKANRKIQSFDELTIDYVTKLIDSVE
ncbi:MAG: HAD-IA family hydrolase [Thermoguttaceae bacterium]|nr:HAD-IA family hydrolase [Thermoguttaceae bacterium]MBR6436569.1 HAD-IA family hydrolase [Thermoguttaceae bacterium]